MTTFVRYGNACAIDSQVTSSAGTISYGHPKVLVVDHMLAHGKHTFMFTGEMTNLNEIADAILCGTMLDRPDLMGDQCVFHIDHGSAQITEYHSEGACDPVRRVTPPDICAAGSARKAAMCMAIAAHEGSIWQGKSEGDVATDIIKAVSKVCAFTGGDVHLVLIDEHLEDWKDTRSK